MRDDALFLGLDVGTQSTKGVLLPLDPEQPPLASAARGYGLESSRPGEAEQHPDLWSEAAREVIEELLALPGRRERLEGIGVSGQQHGLVLRDEKDAVVRPAKLWCDTTAAAEAEELSLALGRPVAAGFTAPKLLWVRRHEPEAFARSRRILLPHDDLNYLLSGEHRYEAGDASGTGWFDPARRALDSHALELLGEGVEERLGRFLPSEEAWGRVSPQGAQRFGLPEGLLVASRSGDNMMSAVGSGACASGRVVVSLGTSGTAFAHSSRPVIDQKGTLAPFCGADGAWLPLLCVMNMTGVTEAVRELLGVPRDELDALGERARAVPPGCDGLVFLPYLLGERTPNLPEATGALLGLRPGSLRPEVLFRAAMEGATCNLVRGLRRFSELGVPTRSLRVVGGGAQSTLWCRILADASGLEVQVPESCESAALGAAIQARWIRGREAGERFSLAEAAEPYLPPIVERLDADPAAGERYGELIERMSVLDRQLYSS